MESHYDKQVIEIALKYMFHTLHYDFKKEQNELLMYLQELQIDKRSICIIKFWNG